LSAFFSTSCLLTTNNVGTAAMKIAVGFDRVNSTVERSMALVEPAS